jgi:hypothetical protein
MLHDFYLINYLFLPLNDMHLWSSCFMVFIYLFIYLFLPLNAMHLWSSCFMVFIYLFIYLFLPLNAMHLWSSCFMVFIYLFIYSFLWTPCIWGGGPNTWHHWLILFECVRLMTMPSMIIGVRIFYVISGFFLGVHFFWEKKTW